MKCEMFQVFVSHCVQYGEILKTVEIISVFNIVNKYLWFLLVYESGVSTFCINNERFAEPKDFTKMSPSLFPLLDIKEAIEKAFAFVDITGCSLSNPLEFDSISSYFDFVPTT